MKINFKDKRLRVLGEKLTEMVQPYVGKIEWGNVHTRIEDRRKYFSEVHFSIEYETIFGSSRVHWVKFLTDENIFFYYRQSSRDSSSEEVRMENLEEILTSFRIRLENIPIERKEDLMICARSNIERGISPKKEIEKKTQFFAKYSFGTADELEFYKKTYRNLYSKKLKKVKK